MSGTSTRYGVVRVGTHRLGVSARYDARVLMLVAAVAVAAVLLGAWSMTLGQYPISVPDVLATVLGRGPQRFEFIVRGLRMPRVLVAAGVGMALAMSGALFQALIRNPLVAPDVLGIEVGASAAAVFVILTGCPPAAVPVAAFGGALLTTFALYMMTWRQGISGNRLVLIGIGVYTALASVVNVLITRFDIHQTQAAEQWLSGTLLGRGWEHVAALLTGMTLLVPAAFAAIPCLRALQLGDEAARALGVDVEAARAGVLVVAAGLAGIAVAAAGPLGFVALMVPHIARLLGGPFTAGVFALAGALGGLLVLVADLVAQHLFSPIILPVGVVTAAIGAPYFLWLLYRTNREG